MSKKYDEIMDQIEVTEEMRQRILKNVQEADIEKKPRVIRFPQWKRTISVAACFAIVIVGVLLAPNLINRTPVQSEPPIDGTSTIEECASLEELSVKVGFPVEGLSSPPFEAQQTTYTSYWGELAQIEYSGNGGQTALYRKSLGADDNSGNYDSFETVLQTTIDGIDVTLKGSGENYSLAWWTDGTYAYSVSLSESVSQTVWGAMISNGD